MTVSIIIAVKTWQKNLEECVGKCLQLDYPDFEVLILPDALSDGFTSIKDPRVKVIPTGDIPPPVKRDIGSGHARGEILAFLDDDAYPDKPWLKNAVKDFEDEETACVGGPGVTPEHDSLRQKASGLIYSSVLVSGSYVYRYLPKPRRLSRDLPSCNLLIRKTAFENVGGFNNKYWPGEDTKLCLDITEKLRKKIIYDPDVLVRHHRREVFLPHLKQVSNYALHRGFFAKRLPENSRKLAYFVPSIFVSGVISGAVISALVPCLKAAYFLGLVAYLSIIFINSVFTVLKSKGPIALIPMVFTGIILTHIAYGVFFLKGLFSKNLKDGK